MTELGHNAFAPERLRSIVERIERLEDEKRGLAADIKDIYTEAKSAGFDVKTLRTLIAERRKDAQEAEEERSLLDIYRDALGQLAGTPLGQAAMERVG
jgi:uncharacterized protein (UPF0335 family)